MDEPQTTTAPPANGLPLLDAAGRPNIPPPPVQPRVQPMPPPLEAAPPPPRHEAPQPDPDPEPGASFEPQTAELFADEPAPAAKDCAIGARAGGALLVVLGTGLLYIGLDLVTGGGISRFLAGVPRGMDEE